MDTAAALAKVDETLALVDRSREMRNNDSAAYYGDEGRRVLIEVRHRLPMIRRIAEAVAPEVVPLLLEQKQSWEWMTVWEGLHLLQGVLKHEDELADILGPSGPRVAADELHPWVWSAAASLWDDGYRRESIQAAATMVDTHAQAKLRRQDISGADLMMQGWSLDPPKPSAPTRLRFTHLEPDTANYRSSHEGAKYFGAGVMLGIRNLATHSLEQPTEQEALEHLAALSVLARWIDEADVISEPVEGILS